MEPGAGPGVPADGTQALARRAGSRGLLVESCGGSRHGGPPAGKPAEPAAGAKPGQARVPLAQVELESCFAAGTPLRTPGGYRPIEELRPGGTWSCPGRSSSPAGPSSRSGWTRAFVHVGVVLALAVGGRVIRTTAEHPFHVADRGWIPAGELRRGRAVGGGRLGPPRRQFHQDPGRGHGVQCRGGGLPHLLRRMPGVGFSVWVHNKNLKTGP